MPVILTTKEANQEDNGSKPAWANILQDPISKNLSPKKKKKK
jgi:hypothetical protein